jgi:hypothetical protein
VPGDLFQLLMPRPGVVVRISQSAAVSKEVRRAFKCSGGSSLRRKQFQHAIDFYTYKNPDRYFLRELTISQDQLFATRDS